VKYVSLVLACALCLGCGAISGPRVVTREGGQLIAHVVSESLHYPFQSGDTAQLVAQTRTGLGNVSVVDNSEITWESVSPQVATVNSSGLVTFLGPGMARITIACRTCSLASGEVILVARKPPELRP
jgi:Bacterial Ig-like domain (group 2)